MYVIHCPGLVVAFNSAWKVIHHRSNSLPPDPPPSLEEPMESISSMKMMEGACSRAMTKSSRTMRDPSPMYFCTSSDPDTLIKQHSVWWATARANRVLPVPGGPYRSTPCNTRVAHDTGDLLPTLTYCLNRLPANDAYMRHPRECR